SYHEETETLSIHRFWQIIIKSQRTLEKQEADLIIVLEILGKIGVGIKQGQTSLEEREGWRLHMKIFEEERERILRNYRPMQVLHPSIALSLNEVGLGCHALGELRKAFLYYEKALEMRKKLYGSQPHFDLVTSLNNVGSIHRALGKGQEALLYYKNALKMCKDLYKDQPHPALIQTLNSVGVGYVALGKAEEGLLYYEEALTMCAKLYKDQPHHPNLALSLSNIGGAYGALGKRKESFECFQKALEIRKVLYNNQPHPSLALSLNNMGKACNNLKAYSILGNYNLGVNYCKQAFQMGYEVYGQAHPHLILYLHKTINALNKVNDPSVIKTTQEELYPLCVKTLGENHEQTQLLMKIKKQPRFLPSFL
ncbi:MAG: tetratricopeptide repeat protein, partial [Candidatus Doudnabacteria bacterium]|nr:tetratricopeptide repeat protein [Candidatus Doudnabacteria bacterium]